MWWTQRPFTSFQSACQNTDLHLAPTTGTVWSFDYSNCSHPVKKQQESEGERGAEVSFCHKNIWKNILQCSMFYHTTTYRGEFAWPALHKLKCLQHSAKLLNETCSRTYQRPMTQSISTVWSAQLISVEVSRGDLGFPLFLSLQWFLSICAVEGHLAKRPVRALLNGLQRLQAGCHVLTCLFQSKHLKCGPTRGYNFIPQYVLDELLWTRPSSLGINLTTTKPGVPISLRCGITGLDKQICHYLVDTQSRWTLSDMICCLNFLCVPKHEGLYIRRIDMRLLDGAANHGVWFMRPECGELSPVWIHRTGTVLQWHIDRGVRFRPTRLQAASKHQPKSTLWLCILFPHQALTCNATLELAKPVHCHEESPKGIEVLSNCMVFPNSENSSLQEGIDLEPSKALRENINKQEQSGRWGPTS